MPKEEEKKCLKILGVDKYSPESTFLLGYVTLFTTVQHRSDSLSRNFRLEVGDGIRAYCRTEGSNIFRFTLHKNFLKSSYDGISYTSWFTVNRPLFCR